MVAPEISQEVEDRAGIPGVDLRRRRFAASDLEGAFLVMVATNQADLNHEIASEARARGVLVNVSDDPDYCDFILPAVVRRGEVQVAVTTGGGSPAFARFLREQLEDLITPEYGRLLDITAQLRQEIRGLGDHFSPDRWQRALHGEALRHLRHGDVESATASMRRALGFGGEGAPREQRPAIRGNVVLVGAGPGDPGLLTIAGREAISSADVVLYDRLVNRGLLELAPESARVVYVGKGPHNDGPMTQDQINELICTEALAGRRVVRLKGGDPFVFGRGGEEALAAIAAGVPVTVIPGVSAAIAVPASAGIPVTHRGLSSAFTVITGQQGPDGPPIDWGAVSRLGGTLVLLMGVEALPAITAQLLSAGMAPTTPAAVIEHGTWPDQRIITGALDNIAARALEAAVHAPSTTVIGAVAALADDLEWKSPSVPSKIENL